VATVFFFGSAKDYPVYPLPENRLPGNVIHQDLRFSGKPGDPDGYGRIKRIGAYLKHCLAKSRFSRVSCLKRG